MKIVFFTHLTIEFPHMISHLADQYRGCQFIFARTKKEYKEALPGSHVLVTGNPSSEDIEAAENLKLIIVPYAGVSQLDFSLLHKKGICLANSHGNAPVVAERAVALALACCGRVVEFHNDQKKGNWHRTGYHHKPFDYWFSMVGKNISILGTGAVGQNIAALLTGFNCQVKGFRRKRGVLPKHFDSVTSDLEEALNFGDIIFMALPITDETRGILSNDNISLLEGKFLINVGRGDLIEEKPFFEALKSRQLRGAGIDAWYDYPSKENPGATGSKLPFCDLKNVVISPHAASHTPEGKMGQLSGALEVIEAYVKDGIIINEISGDY
ncbi:MAG: hypothetical protein JEY91_01720 [Spirochaetaceae bacterium]|nr:hypothetical protein [Spirochaetaceae bacterium]